MKQRRGLERRALVAPALAPGLGVPRHDEAVRPGLALGAHHGVHVGLVDEPLADRRRRRGAAPEALAPGDAPGLGVQREEEALLLGEVHTAVAHRWRKLEGVVCVDRPQPLVRRAMLVRGDVLARVVVPVGRPGPRVVLLRRRLLPPAPRSSRTPPWRSRASLPGHLGCGRTDRPRPRGRSRQARLPAAGVVESRARRMADGLACFRQREEHAPDALCHYRQLEAERRFLELPRPLRRSGPQHDPTAEAKRQEGRLAGVAARGRDPASARAEDRVRPRTP